VSNETLLVLPVLLPWALAVCLALLDGRRRWVGWLAFGGLGTAFALLVALGLRLIGEGTIAVVAGGWPQDVGITLRADPLGMAFALVTAGVILVSLLWEVLAGVTTRTFPALVAFLFAGLTGLFLTGDAFNFYVFFEISMTAAYVLTGYRERDYQVRAAFIFAIINLLGSVVFVIAVAGLYHLTGTLDMETMAERLRGVPPNSVISISVAVFVAFCLKLGLFPFHFWLPAVYVGSHPPVAAMLSGALANIGGYGLLRFGAGIMPEELRLGATVVLVLGAASLVYGALQAISRHATVEVMAYSAIGQAGYILVALAIGGTVGYAAAVVYAIINSLNKALVFLSAGLRGPAVGAAFAVGAFSVVGVPPMAGFLGKLALFRASIEAGSVVLSALIFLGAALSFLYAFQVYQRHFWAKGDEPRGKADAASARLLVVALAALLIAVGVWPEPLLALGEAAAAVLVEGTPTEVAT